MQPDTHNLIAGLKQGLVMGAAVLALVLPQTPMRPVVLPQAKALSLSPQAAAVPQQPPLLRQLDFNGESASPEVQQIAHAVVAAADNGTLPFVVVDKRGARIYVFEPNGRLAGATPVLLGHAVGDDTVPGIGNRPIEQVLPSERTTPAGRFVSTPGRNAGMEGVVWVDYDAAVSMHRVRLNNPAERRLERLASPSADDNRISYGCINVPVVFFDQVLWPRLGGQRGVVYVLPERKALASVFPALTGQRSAQAGVTSRSAL